MLAHLAALVISVSVGDSIHPRPITQLVHTKWTTRDGAPSDIRTLAQTADGYLWLGTGSGLFRFDGVRFVEFTPRDSDSLPTAGISRLKTTRDGSLWIVWANGGLSRLRDGRITTYGTRDGLPPALDITESSRGVIIAATGKGLARFAEGTWTDLGPAWGMQGSEARAVWFDRHDVLWVQTDAYIVYLPAGAQQFVDPGMIVRDRSAPAVFAQEKDGTVWMNELARSAHTLRVFGDSTRPSEVRVRATTVLIDRKGSLWVGSSGDGLRRVLDPTRIRQRAIKRGDPEGEVFTMNDGLLSDIITALFEDREGNVWVASARGLERFREGAFTPITPPGSVRSRIVFATRDSSLWTAAQDMTGIVRISPRDSATIPTTFVITNLAQDSAGSIYSVRNHLIRRFDGRAFAIVYPQQTILGDDLDDLTIDRNGTLWVFDAMIGLMRLDRGRLTPIASLYEPVTRRGVLFSDRTGRIWVGQLNRIAVYDHGQLRIFGADHGVPHGSIFQIMEDRTGTIWAAGEGGITRFEDGRFRNITTAASLPGDAVYGMTEDETGAWWIVTRTSVLRVSSAEIDRAASDSTHAIAYRVFDQLDGLRGTVTATTWGTPVTRTADGRIWVATDSGVASVDPRRLTPPVAPPVMIEAVRVDGEAIPLSDVVRIPTGRRNLAIDFTAINLAIPERIRFRYRLEGEDSDWRDAETERRATYSRLAPGKYRFRVVARNSDGAWGDDSSAWSFRVLPPWYATLWFRAVAIIVIGALGAAATGLVQRRRHLREQKELKRRYEATLAERGRIAQDLHDSLLQGFVGVTLQLRAAELALPDQPEVAGETLRRVQRLARESLREARERVWDLHQTEPTHLELSAALEAVARERAAGTGIEVSAVAVGERRPIQPRIEDTAFRIGREAVANAIRHADPRHIEIVVKYKETAFSVEVRDDGRGFSPEEAEDARRHGHLGLSGARERAAGLGGRCDVHTRREGGTVVVLELPFTEEASVTARR